MIISNSTNTIILIKVIQIRLIYIKKPSKSPTNCPDGYERNPVSQRCRKSPKSKSKYPNKKIIANILNQKSKSPPSTSFINIYINIIIKFFFENSNL